MELIKKDTTTPLCPHCEKPANNLWYRQLKSFWGARYVYFCSACRKIVGVSHRKGFWMG